MRVNGIQCDTCCKLYNDGKREMYFGNIPKGWFTLAASDQEQEHFCSIQCLGQWVEKLATPYAEKPTRFTEPSELDNPARGWRDL